MEGVVNNVKDADVPKGQEDTASNNAVKKILLAMTPEQRAQWAQEQGAPGILALMELQGELLEQKFAELSMQQKQEVLDSLTMEWLKDNEELFKDEDISKVAEGVDLALLKEKGYNSYVEMSPAELKKHLEEVKGFVEKIMSKGKKDDAGKDDSGKKKDDKVRDTDVSLSDLGGGGSLNRTGSLTVEALSNKAYEDPFEFEQSVAQMDDNTLMKLMKEAEGQI